MAVMPDGPAGIDPKAAKYGFTGNNGSISGAAGRTQDVVVRELKEDAYGADFGTNNPWDGHPKMPQGPLLWSVLNALGKSLLKRPSDIWLNINDLFDGLEAIPTALTENTNAIATLQEIAAATNTTQAWVSDLDDMATAPRALVSTVTIGSSAAKPKFKDILFQDDTVGALWQGVCPTVAPFSPFGAGTGDIYYTPIVVDRVGVVDKIRWIAGADSSIGSINYYEMALCIYNPLSGNIEKVWGSGDIKAAEANVGSSSDPVVEAVIQMTVDGAPLDQQCKPGQVLFVAHQQVAPGALQNTRRIAAVPQPPISRTVPLLDAWCFVAPTYTQGIPSSIAMTALTRENRFIPWASVSVNALEPTEDPV